MRVLLPLLLLAGCDRGKGSVEKHVPSGPVASGSLVFTPRSTAEADIFLATEAEVIKSSPILNQVEQRFRVTDLTADAITVTRRPGTTILDVAVRLPDLHIAAERCNELMQTYFEHRMSIKVMALNQQMEALSVQAERVPADAQTAKADLQQKILDLEVKRLALENDVRVLEPCRVND